MKRDRNNSEIANLRRRLKILKEELEEAQNVREEEAELYLNLLEGGNGRRQVELEGSDLLPGVNQFGDLDPVSTEDTAQSQVYRDHYQSTKQEPIRSPAPYPRATSSIKGPVSPRRQPIHSDHDDPYQLASAGSGGDNHWLGQHQQEEKNRNFQSKRMWSTLLRRNSSKEIS